MNVKVYNDDKKDYTEKFQGKQVTVPGLGFIEMGYAKAKSLLSTWTPPIVDGAGRHSSPKKLRIEFNMEERLAQLQQPGIVCMACNEVFNNAVDYDVHVKAVHADHIIDKNVIKGKANGRNHNNKR